MHLYIELIKSKKNSFFISTVLYTILLSVSIHIVNSNSLLYFKIEPYIYGSRPLDFFFVLIVTLGFSYQLFFIKKNNLMTYIGLRIEKKKYIIAHVVSTMLLVFFMVFIANILAVILSVKIAILKPNTLNSSLAGYIFGDLQMENPLVFGLIWSVYKATIGAIICLFGQMSAFYIENLFLSVILPFVLVFLNDFVLEVLGFPEYGITTSFCLNRLTCAVMNFKNIGICIVNLLFMLFVVLMLLRKRYAKNF